MDSKRIKRHYYHTSRNPQDFLDKKFVFSNHFLNKILPKKMYLSEKWSLPELQSRKFILNNVKEKLSDFNLERWSKHTKWRDPSTMIIQNIRDHVYPELLTQAWCKFYECLNKFDVIPQDFSEATLTSLHLCEAPGGFICALNHYLYENYPDVKLEWTGNSLNPYYEGTSLNRMIPDDRFINKTLNKWNFGLDFTGDVTVYYNHEYLIATTIQNEKMHLVTADGSVDCMLNPGEQEKCVEFLHYCETMTALAVLKTGGCFILKIFTMFEESTVCLLLFLNSMFNSVSIFKPCTSKSGNSELYVICLYFKGYSTLSNESWQSLKQPYKAGKLTNSMFFSNEIDPNFMREILDCSDLFNQFQISTMEDNIKDYLSARKQNVKGRNEDICEWFNYLYKMKPLPHDKRLVNDFDVNIFRKKYINNTSSELLSACFDDSTFNPLEIRIGKKIAIVKYSQFCEYNLLINLPLLKEMKKSMLIQNLLTVLSKNNNLISYTDFLFWSDNYDDFQIAFFRKIHQSITENCLNIILYKIPYLTNFVVSVIYILLSGFDNNIFANPGVICLTNSNSLNMKNVILYFDLINKELSNVSTRNQYCFTPSLCAVLNITKMNISFLERIWLYNNYLLKSINSLL